jgi:hypothetical protein
MPHTKKDSPFPLVGSRGKSPEELRNFVERSKEVIETDAARQELVDQLENLVRTNLDRIASKYRERGEKAAVQEIMSLLPCGQKTPGLKEECRRLIRDLAPASTDDDSDADPWDRVNIDDLDRVDLKQLGFPADWWLPWDLALKWQTSGYPIRPSREAVAQWVKLIRGSAVAASVSGDGPRRDRLLAQLANDLELVRLHFPALVPDQAQPKNNQKEGGGCPANEPGVVPNPLAHKQGKGGGKLPEARHSVDFRSVHWFGTDYQFTQGQARIIEILWAAWENGTSDVGHFTLINEAKLNADRITDVFKEKGRHHPAWGSMIVSNQGSKGTCRLQEPSK